MLLLASFLALPAFGGEVDPGGKPALSCDIGPTTKEFAKAQWLMYGCDDRKSAIIVSGAPDAGPFYVMIFSKSGQYRIHGEGGSSSVQAAALRELRALSPKQLDVLVKQANQAG